MECWAITINLTYFMVAGDHSDGPVRARRVFEVLPEQVYRRLATNARQARTLQTVDHEPSSNSASLQGERVTSSKGAPEKSEQTLPQGDCEKKMAANGQEEEKARCVASVDSSAGRSGRRRSVDDFFHAIRHAHPVSPVAQAVRARHRPWFKRTSLNSPEPTSSVPKEYRHLVDLSALLPQRVVESLVENRRQGKQVRPRYGTQAVEAALLFIDISGFTASMERFARQGSQGIEKFWKMFNAYFCDLLDVIQGTGGDIDCFAGDAILIVYETERLWARTGEEVRAGVRGPNGQSVSKLTLATMAASQCGGRLLNKLSPYYFSDGGTDATLTLHGSVGAGSIRTVNVGGPAGHDESFFESFVCGSVFEQLAVAHDLSGKSEFCLSKEAVSLAGHWLDLWRHPEDGGCKILKGVREPENDKISKEHKDRDASSEVVEGKEEHQSEPIPGLTPAKALMPSFYRGEPEHTDLFKRLNLSLAECETLSADLTFFISRSVLVKMEGVKGDGGSEGGGTLGELRRGTVGFIKFEIKDVNSSACDDPERGIQAVAQVVMMASREVLIAGGYINKVIMDEKGLVLLFAFGTPGCSYEHNNLHAIRVALTIRKTSRLMFKRETGVGIATGSMCTGLIGKPNFRSEYALAGDVVNLAARLAAAAEKGKKGVLCDENTLNGLIGENAVNQEAMAAIGVHSQGLMRPKGKSYDIEVFQLTNVNAKEFERTRMAVAQRAETQSNALRSVRYVNLGSRHGPLKQMREMLKSCDRGDVQCVFLEADAGLGKTTLVSALCEAPYVSDFDSDVRETAAGGACKEMENRDVYVVKAQAAHLEQSTPYYVLSALVRALITLIVQPDSQGRISMVELADVMPAEAHRFLELVRYLQVPLVAPTEAGSASTSTKRRRRSLAGSIGGQRRGSQQTISNENTSRRRRSFSVDDCSYGFQRFADEDHDALGHDSVKHLTRETAEFLCREMRENIEIKDRDYGRTVYKNAFVGTEAVDWLCEKDYAGSRTEAVAIGQRLVEFGLVDHVNSVFRFKDALLYFEFRDSTTCWPKAVEMDLATGKTLALRIHTEIQATTQYDQNGEVHKGCFSGATLVSWMLKERVATCMSEAFAIADRLMCLCIVESADPDLERFKPSPTALYHLRALALHSLPPTHIFPVLQQLCLCILQVSCKCAAEEGQLVLVAIEDLHWVDAGTLDMIQGFLEVGLSEPWDGGCMFVLTSRPATSFPAHLREKRDHLVGVRDITSTIVLGTLADEEAVHLTCQLLKVDELDFGLRKLVVTSCSGSPLFICEICQSLCSTDGVQTVVTSSKKTRAVLKTRSNDGLSNGVPTSVQEIVAARIDSLDATVALVLKVAAVIGETFAFDTLHTVFPLDVDESVLREHLKILVAHNFLVASTDAQSGRQFFRFTHSLMSVAAYGMLLHSYRWRLHYHVVMAMAAVGGESNMVLARHWLQVAKADPSTEEIKDLGGPEAHREMLATAISVVSQAIGDLMGMGQFIDASLFFKAGLDVLGRIPERSRRTDLEIDLLLHGCQLTQFTEGYNDNLFAYASKAYQLSCQQEEGVRTETRVRAGLFVAQHQIMYGDTVAAIERVQELFDDISPKEVALRIEPAATLVAVLTQRGQFQQARAYTKVIEEWKSAGSPPPLCLVLYEPVVTLMSMSVILAAMGADDSKHLRWINELERYLKECTASKQPFNLYASMSLFGALYPMCFEYVEMVRFYHAVYRVVYHPQVLLPVRRGLMFQAPTAVSRVQAKNPIITQGIEVMSLMVNLYDAVNVKGPTSGKQKPKYFLKELLSIVKKEPTAATCAAVYQAAHILHHWPKARMVLELWNALGPSSRRQTIVPPSNEAPAVRDPFQSIVRSAVSGNPDPDAARGRGDSEERDDEALDIYRAVRLYCMGAVEVEEIEDERLMREEEGPPVTDADEERWLERFKIAAQRFKEAADTSSKAGNGLMEVRARTAFARVSWTKLDGNVASRQSLRQVFDKFDTLCSQPNFFTPLRLTGLTSAMRLNGEMGGCYSSSNDGNEDSDEYGFGQAVGDSDEEDSDEEDSDEEDSDEEDSDEGDDDDEEEEEEEDEKGEDERQKERSEDVSKEDQDVAVQHAQRGRKESRLLFTLDREGNPHDAVPVRSDEKEAMVDTLKRIAALASTPDVLEDLRAAENPSFSRRVSGGVVLSGFRSHDDEQRSTFRAKAAQTTKADGGAQRQGGALRMSWSSCSTHDREEALRYMEGSSLQNDDADGIPRRKENTVTFQMADEQWPAASGSPTDVPDAQRRHSLSVLVETAAPEMLLEREMAASSEPLRRGTSAGVNNEDLDRKKVREHIKLQGGDAQMQVLRIETNEESTKDCETEEISRERLRSGVEQSKKGSIEDRTRPAQRPGGTGDGDERKRDWKDGQDVSEASETASTPKFATADCAHDPPRSIDKDVVSSGHGVGKAVTNSKLAFADENEAYGATAQPRHEAVARGGADQRYHQRVMNANPAVVGTVSDNNMHDVAANGHFQEKRNSAVSLSMIAPSTLPQDDADTSSESSKECPPAIDDVAPEALEAAEAQEEDTTFGKERPNAARNSAESTNATTESESGEVMGTVVSPPKGGAPFGRALLLVTNDTAADVAAVYSPGRPMESAASSVTKSGLASSGITAQNKNKAGTRSTPLRSQRAVDIRAANPVSTRDSASSTGTGRIKSLEVRSPTLARRDTAQQQAAGVAGMPGVEAKGVRPAALPSGTSSPNGAIPVKPGTPTQDHRQSTPHRPDSGVPSNTSPRRSRAPRCLEVKSSPPTSSSGAGNAAGKRQAAPPGGGAKEGSDNRRPVQPAAAAPGAKSVNTLEVSSSTDGARTPRAVVANATPIVAAGSSVSPPRATPTRATHSRSPRQNKGLR